LFHKMQTALGGRDKIAAVYDLEQCVRAETRNNDGTPHGEVFKRTRWINPNLLRLDQVGPDDSYVLFFDGASGWEILLDKGFADLKGNELAFAQGYLSGINLKFWLADRDLKNVFSSNGPAGFSISSKEDISQRTDIKLDPTTLLPSAQIAVSLVDPNHPMATQTLQFRDWVEFRGIKFPRRTINFHGDRKLADITLQRITLNSRLQPKNLLTRPGDLKPVMGSCR
jgi:hypothetical protein